jgi:hypothetical protein
MIFSPDDVVTLSSLTALGMGENLILTLNTIIMSLPEAELRRIHQVMGETIRLTDDLLENLSISSAFEMLSMNDGTFIHH